MGTPGASMRGASVLDRTCSTGTSEALTLAAVTGPAATFEVARVEGTELSARVAPGSYRAAYLLAGRELASADTQVSAGATEQIVLEVRSVSFVLVSARPVKEDGKVVVADLVASVENHLQPLEGPVALGATVLRDGQEVDTVVLDELDGLPIGVTEATLTYRPPEGFPEGTYRFEFTLATPEFTVTSPEEPSFTVTGNEPFPLLGAGAAAAGAGIAGVAVWKLLRRRKRRARPIPRHSTRG